MFQGAVGILFVDKFLYVYSSAIGRVFCRIFGARGCPRLSVFLFGPRSVGNPSCCVVSGSVTRLCLWSARVQHACLSSLVRMSLLRELFFFVVGSVATIGGLHGRFVGLLQFVFLRNRDSNAKFGRSWAMPLLL